MGERTKKSFFNIGTNFITTCVKYIMSFITRTVFIYCLGKNELGLNGLFTNILSMLSLVELGIGTAINFSLYKPLAEHDNKKISILMGFYKKAYRIIGIIVTFLGLSLIPFLKYLINDITNIDNVYLIYILYLINTVSTYFISYKETLINADQKKYKLFGIETISVFLLNVFQMIFLLLTKNFIVYLIINFIVLFIQRIITNIFITRNYKDIDFNSKDMMEKDDLKPIVKNVKAMFFHKIGDYCINSTDNLIISSFISIAVVGIYSNYLTIITMINSIINMIYSGIVASLGNLVATETVEKKEEIFDKMNFLGFLFYGYCSVCLINLFNTFITIWIGTEYCFNFNIVLIMILNFYLAGMRIPPHTMKSAAGLFDVDKYTPILQSLINLVISIFLAKKMGILGVLLGTLISSLAIPCWQRPYLIYKHVFMKSSKKYFYEYFKEFVILLIISCISLYINSLLIINNLVLLFIIKLLIVTILFAAFIILIFHNTKEFKYVVKIINKVLNFRKEI